MKRIIFRNILKNLVCMILALVLVFSFCLPTVNAKNTDTKAVDYRSYANPNYGASVEPDEERIYKIGETWVVDGQWEITINSVTKHPLCNSYSNDRNGYTSEEVVLINYTYKNIGYDRDDGLFVASTSFDVYDQEIESAKTYACTHRDYAKSCKIVGSKCTAEEAYVLHNDSEFITLVISMYHAENGEMCQPEETAIFYLYTVNQNGEIEHTHSWNGATCTTAKTCELCGVTEGSASGHAWGNGKCSRCGDVLKSRFVDVLAGSYYFDPVEWAVENGITTGTDETHFSPVGSCQRAAVVTFLWRAAGSPEPATTECPFTDVAENAYYYKAVLWAVEKGITKGTSETEFSPFKDCTRAQVVTFLWRAQNNPESTAEVSFKDVEEGKFYTDAVAWAVANGVTNGLDDTTFGVNATCNRAQVVTFLYRANAA